MRNRMNVSSILEEVDKSFDSQALPKEGEIQVSRFFPFTIDFLLFLFSFFFINALEQRDLTLSMDPLLPDLLILTSVIWLLVALCSGRLKLERYRSLNEFFHFFLRTIIYMLFVTTLAVNIFGMNVFFRHHVCGTFGLLLLLELAVIPSLYFKSSSKWKKCSFKNGYIGDLHMPLAWIDMSFLLISYFGVHYLLYDVFYKDTFTLHILIIHIGVGLVSATWTHKYKKTPPQNIYFAYPPFFKSGILTAAVFALLVFGVGLYKDRLYLLFGPIPILMLLELPLCFFYCRTRLMPKEYDIEDIDVVNRLLQQEKTDAVEVEKIKLKKSVRDKLELLYLTERPDLFSFLENNINLDCIESTATRVFNTDKLFKIKALENFSIQFFINFNQINNFRHLNDYFLNVHRKLTASGYFVGCKNRFDDYHEQIYQKYPPFMARLIYSSYVLFRQVLPGIPGIRCICRAIPHGRNTVISKAELLGRLYFCGFRVINVTELNGHIYYIVQKAKSPLLYRNPSQGLFIELKRIGYQGQVIRIKKLRTMYPYSEYIQDIVFSQNRLNRNGKIRDDFRVTKWGKFFRRLWLDELPQLINYLHGDLSLVGVRALSEHYFNLYPKDVQNLRIKTKPGLIPPYYADMPKDFDAIVKSERIYLERKLQEPFSTDVLYFCKAIYNIVFKRARSA
ncbi:hypothetical protein GF407_17580 [candidate division KSB1 bacterium]|nr:hypothetical protein [candidate division KSB1 bacterium]